MGKDLMASGKTVDEAIFKGLNEMGLSFDEVRVEIMQNETHGVFGLGAKPAIVKLVERDKTEDTIDVLKIFRDDDARKANARHDSKPLSRQNSEPSATYGARANSLDEQQRREQPRSTTQTHNTNTTVIKEKSVSIANTTPVVQQGNNFKENTQRYKPSSRPQRQDYGRYSRSYHDSQPVQSEIEYSQDLAKTNTTAQFLSNLLELMKFDATVEAAMTSNGLKLRINSENSGALIGHRGETLDALQYLTLLTANKERSQNDYLRVTIDTQGYRQKREEVLVRLAKSKASAVRASGKPYKFEPMSPYERRIIHSTLQSHPYVTTHSEGDEPNRCVVIIAKPQPYKNRAPQNNTPSEN